MAAIIKNQTEASPTEQKTAAELARLGRQHVAKLRSLPAQAKIWCEAAIVFPDIENLVECARFNLESLNQASNPVPTLAEARSRKARRGLILLEAAVKLAQRQNAAPVLLDRLKRNLACYQEIVQNPAVNCP